MNTYKYWFEFCFQFIRHVLFIEYICLYLDSKLSEKDDIRNNNNNDSRSSIMDVEQASGKLSLPPPPPPMLPRPVSNDERGKLLTIRFLQTYIQMHFN